ncbi:hypothetical protein PM082_017639 [Marasmius tenuissimus]|nr:hypothetical protein PM082_017639 [Marasmius tenuissimus]
MNTLQSPKKTQASGYLNPSVDPSTLGFLLISLGGGRAVSSSPPSSLTDWDGIGIVTRREEIVDLVTTHRQRLSELLWIAKEECPCWEGFDSPPADSNREWWDVLRFSGRGEDGAKRTIKIWSMESLLSTSSSPRPCRLGVLSSRCVHSFATGNILNVYQPQPVSSNLFILEDADFITHMSHLPNSDDVPASLPGVTCDLLLTAVSVYVSCKDMVRLISFQLTSKWLTISGAGSNIESFISCLYPSEKFSEAYRRQLSENMISFISDIGRDAQRLKIRLLGELGPLAVPCEPRISFVLDQHSNTGYSGVKFIGRSSWIPAPVERSLEEPPSTSMPSYTLKADSTHPVPPSPFSSNSTAHIASLCFTSDESQASEWREVFFKSGPGIATELSILPTVQKHFPPHVLQQACGYDTAREVIIFSRFHGKSLNEVRLELLNNPGPYDPAATSSKREVFRCLVNIELARSRHVMAAQLSTFSTEPELRPGAERGIHRFFHDRLHLNRRMTEFYGGSGSDVSFLRTEGNKCVTVDELMALPLIINGIEYPSLESQFRRAEVILDPAGQHLHRSATAFGLGDGHGGNLMVPANMDSDGLRFIDFEVAGYHHPILDQAKPLYVDAFFGVLYKELVQPGGEYASKINVQWEVAEETINIDYAVQFNLLDRALAVIKLECVLRPLLDRLVTEAPTEVESSIELLSAALFTNALLTRNFSKLPAEVFFLNCAVGTTLMHDIKSAFKSFFDWDSWPEETGGVVALRRCHDADHESGFLDGDSLLLLLEALLNRTINETTLEPGTVFLKRFEDTLQLHRRFSKDQGESSGAVTRRISTARALGIKIAPHTCIRECIFAEPRIDYHFVYRSILEKARELGTASKRLVDVGCCMGSDIRKLIVDGFDAENILGIDLEKGKSEDLSRIPSRD